MIFAVIGFKLRGFHKLVDSDETIEAMVCLSNHGLLRRPV